MWWDFGTPFGNACEILGHSGSNQEVRGGTEGDYDFGGVGVGGDGDGYYSVEYAVMDDAGNRADFITAGGVIDGAAPTASVLAPATREAGERTTFSAFVSDNLDLNRGPRIHRGRRWYCR